MKSIQKGHPVLSKVFMIIADAVIVNLAYYLALFVRFFVKGGLSEGVDRFLPIFFRMIPFYALICIGVFYLFRLYNTMWEYAGAHELKLVTGATLVTSVIHTAMSLLVFGTMPISYYLLGPFIQVVLLVVFRYGYKIYLMERNHTNVKKSDSHDALIIGVDNIAQFARAQLENTASLKIVGFIDCETSQKNRFVNGIPVYTGLASLDEIVSKKPIGTVVIADNTMTEENKQEIENCCKDRKIDIVDFIQFLQNNNASSVPVVLKSEEKGARVIPFSPPDISELEIKEVNKALRSGWITTGPRTKELEKRLAAYCHTSKVVCLNSATAAEELNFRVCGIGEGDEVIVPAYTYTATASAAIHCGAKVIFVDSQKDNCEMDYDKVAEVITEKTKAIVAVDLGGIIADYDKLFAVVESKRALFRAKEGNDLGARIQQAVGRVLVFADCAHALGASRHGKMAGEIADFTDFSFHAVKNFTTAEGGASTWRDIPGIDNEEMYHQYQLYSLHGQSKDALAKTKVGAWEYDIIGPWYKCNMTDIMAAIGLRQLDRYEGLLKRRGDIIKRYDAMCDELGIKHLIHSGADFQSSNHLYLTRIPGASDETRRRIITKLAERGVNTNVHYKPLPMMTAYKAMGWDIKDFPNAFAYYENLITLPLHTCLKDEDVEYVIETYRDVVKAYL